jgi:hypothetical protein
VSQSAVGDNHDTMKKLEDSKLPLDPLKPTDVKPLVHEKTEQEKLADDPESIFVGRNVDALTHPTITSKVPESERGRGKILGQEKLCSYLLDVTLGIEETIDLHGLRLYDLVAKLECDWASCRLCQQRMYHVFNYCTKFGASDWLLRGVCEDKSDEVQRLRLAKMVFHDNPASCRLWKDMQVLNARCGPDDAAVCQGAYDFAEVCKSLGLNASHFLQRGKFDDLVGWFCNKSKSCSSSYTIQPSSSDIQIQRSDFGAEKGALGLSQ